MLCRSDMLSGWEKTQSLSKIVQLYSFTSRMDDIIHKIKSFSSTQKKILSQGIISHHEEIIRLNPKCVLKLPFPGFIIMKLKINQNITKCIIQSGRFPALFIQEPVDFIKHLFWKDDLSIIMHVSGVIIRLTKKTKTIVNLIELLISRQLLGSIKVLRDCNGGTLSMQRFSHIHHSTESGHKLSIFSFKVLWHWKKYMFLLKEIHRGSIGSQQYPEGCTAHSKFKKKNTTQLYSAGAV